jgi:hypothetical protein
MDDFADEDNPVIVSSIKEVPEHAGVYVIEIDAEALAALQIGKLIYQTVNSHEYSIVVKLKLALEHDDFAPEDAPYGDPYVNWDYDKE